MRNVIAVAALVAAVGVLGGCSCFDACAPACPEPCIAAPVYTSPCCPAPTGRVSGSYVAIPGGGGPVGPVYAAPSGTYAPPSGTYVPPAGYMPPPGGMGGGAGCGADGKACR